MADPKTADLHRMVMDKHICPWGIRALHLLKAEGFKVNDHWLTTREAVDAFKLEHGVKTTPQIFIDGERIGGLDDLRRRLGKPVPDKSRKTYAPVLTVFAVCALMAAAAGFAAQTLISSRTIEWFVAFSMCALAMLKLRDLESFAVMFLGYDVLARRWPPYAFIYPFIELGAGVLMIAGSAAWLSVPAAALAGTIGSWSVFKAVYLQKRELKCACVGGDSNVPLGFVSLTENLAMIGMALWMGLMAWT